MTPEQRRSALWRAGRTAWKLRPTPRRIYEQIKANKGRNPQVIVAHRNFAKTTLAVTVADERCRQNPGHRVVVALRTKDQTASVIREIMGHYLQDCPTTLRPLPVKSEYTWRYPNGSEVFFFGGDNQAIESARGRGFHDGIFDEGGFQRDLAYNVRSVVLPAMAKLGGDGFLLIPSTPSREPGHDFEVLYEQARADNRAARVSVVENPDLTPEWIADRARECGGEDSIDFRREYLCQFLADPDIVVLPGVTEERIAGTDGRPALVQPVPVNMIREWYASMDIGGRHLTGVLWGYYDYDPADPMNGTVRIARELIHRNASTPELARDITRAERALFGDRFPSYFERWADNNNLFLLHDLAKPPFRVVFQATQKDEKMAQVGILRRLIADGRFVIDPSCVTLLRTLRTAQWATTGKGFAEASDIGHADLLDAALYLVRNVRRRPYPQPMPTLMEQMRIPGAPPEHRSAGIRALRRHMLAEGIEEI